MTNYKTEYLILHEDEIDWDSLSKDESRSFTLAEIRMFRKRINWLDYLKTHNMSPEQLEIASKHFTKKEYELIAMFDMANEEFFNNHKENLNWLLIIGNCNISANFLSDNFSYWKDLPKEKLEEAFRNNKKIDVHDGTYDAMILYLKLDI